VDVGYLAGEAEWNYMGIDDSPPVGVKLNILTSGGIAVQGTWRDDSDFIAWAPLIRRNKLKEELQTLVPQAPYYVNRLLQKVYDLCEAKDSDYAAQLLKAAFDHALEKNPRLVNQILTEIDVTRIELTLAASLIEVTRLSTTNQLIWNSYVRRFENLRTTVHQGESMLSKSIMFCGRPVVLSCDGNCAKAWGMDSRPKIVFDLNDPDDFAYVSDEEFELAPTNPGTYEGDHAKPLAKEDRLNKWCSRQCERSVMAEPNEPIVLPEFKTRRYNKPSKHR